MQNGYFTNYLNQVTVELKKEKLIEIRRKNGWQRINLGFYMGMELD